MIPLALCNSNLFEYHIALPSPQFEEFAGGGEFRVKNNLFRLKPKSPTISEKRLRAKHSIFIVKCFSVLLFNYIPATHNNRTPFLFATETQRQ